MNVWSADPKLTEQAPAWCCQNSGEFKVLSKPCPEFSIQCRLNNLFIGWSKQPTVWLKPGRRSYVENQGTFCKRLIPIPITFWEGKDRICRQYMPMQAWWLSQRTKVGCRWSWTLLTIYRKWENILDHSGYVKIAKEPTKHIERKLLLLLKHSGLSDVVLKSLKLHSLRPPPKLYGLPQIHKDWVPLRPIVSTIESLSYHLAKFLTGSLAPFIGQCDHHVKNSAEFVAFLQTLCLKPTNLFPSFGVFSLFYSGSFAG